MIEVTVNRNKSDEIYCFQVKNHGPSILCAAVSMLVINTINCIEHFTTEKIEYTQNKNTAVITCSFPKIESGKHSSDVSLLLNTMMFGLNNLVLEYNGDILIHDN